MPIYDYTCPACGHSFTVRQGFFDQPEAPCPHCGTTGRRRFSVPSVVYKGSGFYSTDYGRRSGGALSDGPGPASSEGAGHSEAGDGQPLETSSHSHPHPHPD